MDWRTGKPNTTGSAFRGISTRGRGRGRGRAAPPSGRGGHSTTPTESVVPISAPPFPSAPTQGSTTPASNPPLRPKPTSRRGSHQHARRAPSLSHLDLPKAVTAAADQTTTSPHHQLPRRASHNPIGVPQNESNVSHLQIPSVKLDTLSPSTPTSPRPKPARKRSQNRTRSSSKASTQDRLSATASIASLKDKEKDTPPHLALASAPPDVQSFDLRTNIDTLVERVRAMAMAGSAVERDKDKEGHYTPNDGHIDWAGDDDDTLPDLDDWVRPKSAEPKEMGQVPGDKSSEKPVLSPVEEGSHGFPPKEKGQETKQEQHVTSQSAKEGVKHAEEAKEVKELKATNEVISAKEKESTSGRAKTRGKHSKKKPSTLESLPTEFIPVTPVSKSPATGFVTQNVTDASMLSSPKIRPPLVHPLPPKPQLAHSLPRGSKLRATPQATPITQPVTHLPEGTVQKMTPPEPSAEIQALAPPIDLLDSNANVENNVMPSQQAKKRAFNPAIDWANAPPLSSDAPSTESVSDANIGAESSPASGEPPRRKRAFDSSIDWAAAPPQGPSSTRRSPTRGTPSPKRARPFSPPSVSHPHTAPPHGRPRSLHPHSRNGSPPVFPDLAHDTPHPAQTRSQMNSPESSPRRWPNRDSSTHLRSHSSPQTGPGTRTHTSRPVITLDALSRISRTLGVPGTTTPPRGQTVGVGVTE